MIDAPVAKSANAPNSKLGSLRGMRVRVPPGVLHATILWMHEVQGYGAVFLFLAYSNVEGYGCIHLLFVVRVTVAVRSGHEENCKSKKE